MSNWPDRSSESIAARSCIPPVRPLPHLVIRERHRLLIVTPWARAEGWRAAELGGLLSRVLLILPELPQVAWVDPAGPVTPLPNPDRSWLARLMTDRLVLALELRQPRPARVEIVPEHHSPRASRHRGPEVSSREEVTRAKLAAGGQYRHGNGSRNINRDGRLQMTP